MSNLKSSLSLLLATLLCPLLASTSAEAARPKLGVILIFDQMPAWLLDRYSPFFDGGHFGGLDGARFDAVYPYAATETGPGHATLSTCSLPAQHGIATNSWFANGKKLYAVDDPAFPVLLSGSQKADYGRSPRMLEVNTLGDAIKNESAGRARVVTLSHKDRAAILSAGHAADLAVWYDVAQGRYTSSTAYVDKLPPWLEDLGLALPTKTLAEGTWSPLPIPAALQGLAPKDDRAGEADLKGFDATFPHDIKDIPAELKKNDYRFVPQSMSDLFTLALRAVDEEGLGKDDEPDLLVVSVSTTDVVGHNYGGGSLEQLDTLRRADQLVRQFMSGLDQRVGHQNIVVSLTSDHGAPDVPASIIGSGLDTPLLAYVDVTDVAEKAVASVLPGKARILGYYPPQLFVDDADLDAPTKAKVYAAVETAVEGLAGVAQVYVMGRDGPDEDAWQVFMRASAPRGRSAALFVRTDPRVVVLEVKGAKGTDHGTPYLYDRRVPFIVAGPGVRRGRFATPVDTRDVSPTMAFLMGVSPPDTCEGKPAAAAVGDR